MTALRGGGPNFLAVREASARAGHLQIVETGGRDDLI